MIRVAAVVGVICFSGTALAETPEKTPDEAFQALARSFISANRKIFVTRDNLLRTFHTTDADGDGKITKEDYKLLQQIGNAKQRSYVMQKWSTMDLNGDGKVENKEMNTIFLSQASQPFNHQGVQITPTKEQITLILEKLVQKESDSDLNKDGDITFEEMLKSANEQIKQRGPGCRYSCNRRIPLSLDKNNDQAVDLEEFKSEVELIIQYIDKDKDGKISHEESNTFRSHSYQLRRKLRK